MPADDLFSSKEAIGMSTLDASASFLCFLPEVHGKLSFVENNGISESLHIPSSKSIPRKMAQACNGRSQISSQNSEKLVVSGVHVDSLIKEASDPRSTSLDIESNSSGHERLASNFHADVRLPRCMDSLENVEQAVIPEVGDDEGTSFSMENEDELAFEIAEFFKAFEKGEDLLRTGLKVQPERLQGMVLAKAQEASLGIDDRATSDETRFHAVPKGERGSGEMIPMSINVAGHTEKWCDDGELDTFSGALPFSGPMTYMGHSNRIPFSGSLSHRSDSSSASTRSFAFPILPFEWNSSPVKMGQPDRRYVQRRWRRRVCKFFCCKDPSSFN